MLTVNQIQKLLIVGLMADAMGVPVEFKQRGTYRVTEMIGHGTYDQPAGTWSDDSALTLCLAENLTQQGTPTTLMTKMVAYLLEGDYTPAGQLFDIGNATRRSLISFLKGVPATQCGDPSEFANGNGALMRLAPLAVALISENKDQRRLQQIKWYTQLTHAHERSLIGSWLYLELLRQLFKGVTFEKACQHVWQVAQQQEFTPTELKLYQPMFQPNFKATSVDRIPSTGYVVDSLGAALWLVQRAGNLRALILQAVNLGDDTDTIAQLAATLWLARYPDTPLPKDWLTQLQQTPQAVRIIKQFAETFGN